MEPVAPAAVISAAPSVPDTPVGGGNDLFNDIEVKTEKVKMHDNTQTKITVDYF